MADNMLTWALAYASAGVAVFPCHPDKRPRTRNGFKDASTDPDVITGWWATTPAAMIGVPTEGFVIVDLDEKPGHIGETWQWWQGFAGANGWQPNDTPMSVTPSGGVHIWWRAPSGAQVRNSAGLLAPRVDVRASGGYAIVAPSTNPTGGYEWLNGDVPTVEAPRWLVVACTQPKARPVPAPVPSGRPQGTPYGLRALETEVGRMATAPDGQRNDTLVKAAYRVAQLAAGGELDGHHAADQLLTVALRTGLDEREAQGTIRSGMSAGSLQPRSA